MDFEAGPRKQQTESHPCGVVGGAGAAAATSSRTASSSDPVSSATASASATATAAAEAVADGALVADTPALGADRGFATVAELLGRLVEVQAALSGFVDDFGSRVPDCREAAALLRAGEQVGRLAERVQLAVTLAADRAVVADVGKPVSGAGRSQFKDTVDFMVSALHIRRGEAFARLSAARALLPRTALGGQELQPAFPQLSSAVASGEVPVGTAMIAVRSLQKLSPSSPSARMAVPGNWRSWRACSPARRAPSPRTSSRPACSARRRTWTRTASSRPRRSSASYRGRSTRAESPGCTSGS